MKLVLQTPFDSIELEKEFDTTIKEIKNDIEVLYGVPCSFQKIEKRKEKTFIQSKDSELLDDVQMKDLLENISMLEEISEISTEEEIIYLQVIFKKFPSFLDSFVVSVHRRILRLFSQNFERISWWSQLFFSFLITCFGSFFLVICSQIFIPLSWTHGIPISGQTLGIKLISMFQGTWKAFLSSLLYILYGTFFGMQIFSSQVSGWKLLEGASGGFIVGFPIAAAFSGFLFELSGYRYLWIPSSWRFNPMKGRIVPLIDFFASIFGFLVIVFGSGLIIFIFGVSWMAWGFVVPTSPSSNQFEFLYMNSTTRGIGLSSAIEKGVLPFLPGEIVKSSIAVLIAISVILSLNIFRKLFNKFY
jgi:biotin transporter BioY